MNTGKSHGYLLALLLGIAVGAAVAAALLWHGRGAGAAGETAAAAERKPLYWVAPMDPNYRRDAPGKSPMGMDLIPVYEEEAGAGDTAGLVAIAPEVVNSLGVRTATAQRRALPARIRTVGYVEYDEDRRIHIHPRVEGWIEKLYVKASGDPVQAGQALYDLYSPPLVNAQEEFLLALKRNDPRLVQASRERLLALQLAPDFIEQLQRDRKVRQTVTFHAPQSGVVDNLNVREGFFVQPGTMLMSVGALDDVWVEAEVFERQADLVRVGQPVSMSLDYLPGRSWPGTVDYVYPALDAQTRTLPVRLRFDNPEGILKPNMFAQVMIETDPGADVLVVPQEAVIRTGAQDRVVLALGGGRFRAVPVTLGRLEGGFAEIRDGLAAGDEVVVSAQFLLDSESSRDAEFTRMEDAGGAAPAGGHEHHGRGQGG